MTLHNGDGPPPLPCMGDLVLTLLAGTLSGLRDRLAQDGHGDDAEVVADLVEIVDDYMAHAAWRPEPRARGTS